MPKKAAASPSSKKPAKAPARKPGVDGTPAKSASAATPTAEGTSTAAPARAAGTARKQAGVKAEVTKKSTGGSSKSGSGKVSASGTVTGPGTSRPAKEELLVAVKKSEAPAKKAGVATKATGSTRSKGKDSFLDRQRQMLLEERQSYMSSAEALKAQADSLALEHEPGDVQFDEEGGEGGTANVDREIDLYLSAQARATVVEIDRALEKIADGTYGTCEHCGGAIPEARLEALPYAALCVTCKSGGLSSRR